MNTPKSKRQPVEETTGRREYRSKRIPVEENTGRREYQVFPAEAGPYPAKLLRESGSMKYKSIKNIVTN